MFASVASLLATPLVTGFFLGWSKVSRAQEDFQALLARMRQRLYPETLPALASFWLQTVCANGYSLRLWKELHHLLNSALREQLLDDPSREVIIEIKNWIQERVFRSGQRPESVPQLLEPVRASLDSERLTAFIIRLLNEWVPLEVARLLIDEGQSTVAEDSGIPVLTIGSAIKRLLVREHLSRATLEMMLEPELLSPEYVYPADLEMLRDVVLSLLGRTQAPTPSVMPATLLCVAPNSHLPADYREELRHAFVISRPRGEEVHVPIAPARTLEMIVDRRIRIGSIIVTMDGRWWESENFLCDEQHYVVYRPVGRLRIDYSKEHARLRVPWPETRLYWSGGDGFRKTFKIFGREWHISKWEVDAERTWLHLVFSRVLPMSEIVPAADTGLWRLRPASVDMAWAALEGALTSSLVQKSSQPIELLRHSDLIPLGHSLAGLAESVMSRGPQTYEAIETQLTGLRDLESPIVSTYGRVPWRILPQPVRAILLRVRGYPVLLGLLDEVFEGLPEALSQATDVSSTARKPVGRAEELREEGESERRA